MKQRNQTKTTLPLKIDLVSQPACGWENTQI